MIDLKEIVTKYPECLANSEKFRNYLKDLYPERADQVRIKVLADAMSCGIVDEIKAGRTGPVDVTRYRTLMEQQYGYSSRLVFECVVAWVRAFEPEVIPDLEVRDALSTFPDFEIEGRELSRYIGADSQVMIPDYFTSIGEMAFQGCEQLTQITIPNSVTNIGKGAFDGCKNLTSISLPNSVVNIGEGAFVRCSSLTNITIPFGVANIGPAAFGDCYNLKQITIPDSVERIDSVTFAKCRSLKEITISNNVTTIGEAAFFACSSLKQITIPNGVTRIEKLAFRDCNSLKSITIHNSVKYIGENAFYGCKNLDTLYFVGTQDECYNLISGKNVLGDSNYIDIHCTHSS